MRRSSTPFHWPPVRPSLGLEAGWQGHDGLAVGSRLPCQADRLRHILEVPTMGNSTLAVHAGTVAVAGCNTHHVDHMY